MLSAYNQERKLVIAWNVNKKQGPFICPECGRVVVVKKGQFIIHHFAHTPNANCSYGTGETFEHWQAKYEMYEALRTNPRVSDLQVELPLGAVRPDIIFCWDGKVVVVIELQRSNLPPNDAARRTSIYAEKDIAVLWVSLPRGRFLAGQRCSTRVWELFLHELYDGKIFCWWGGSVLMATHLNPCELRTEYRKRYDKNTGLWYLKEITRYAKRLRIPHYDDAILVTDMKVVEVLPQQRGQFMLPKAKLWSL
jgi:competence protein CoiA